MAGANKKALLGMLGADETEQPGVSEEPDGGDAIGGPLSPNTGIAGDVVAAGAQPIADAPPLTTTGNVPAASTPSADFGRVMGFDAGKFNDPNKHDFKYDTGRVLSRFDPRQGFTPDVIAALNNELGGTYGNFSGSGDKLSLTGAKGAKDAADFANQDWVYALKAGNDATKWNFGGGGAAPQDAGDPAQGGGVGLPAFGGAQLDSALNGDPLAKIQQLIAQMSGSRPNFAALMQQLGGGG